MPRAPTARRASCSTSRGCTRSAGATRSRSATGSPRPTAGSSRTTRRRAAPRRARRPEGPEAGARLKAVLVTGGAGYIGSAFVEALIAAGQRVVVLDDLSRGHHAAVHADALFPQGRTGDRAPGGRTAGRHTAE